MGLHQGDGHTSPFALTPQPGSPALAEGGSSAPSVLFRANAARRTSPTRPVTFFCWERLWKSPTQVPGTASSSPIEQAALRPHPHPFSLLVMGQPPTADVLTGMTPKMGPGWAGQLCGPQSPAPHLRHLPSQHSPGEDVGTGPDPPRSGCFLVPRAQTQTDMGQNSCPVGH